MGKQKKQVIAFEDIIYYIAKESELVCCIEDNERKRMRI